MSLSLPAPPAKRKCKRHQQEDTPNCLEVTIVARQCAIPHLDGDGNVSVRALGLASLPPFLPPPACWTNARSRANNKCFKINKARCTTCVSECSTLGDQMFEHHFVEGCLRYGLSKILNTDEALLMSNACFMVS
jgi:hypothetical protein